MVFNFNQKRELPLIIAGPCMAESFSMLEETLCFLLGVKERLGFDFIFKASFDKANRTSISSFRGHGLTKTMEWMSELKSKYSVPMTTDVHETVQISTVSHVVDVIQIPAFLCRQTDLVVEAVKTGKAVNVKKGQFMSPYSVSNIYSKVKYTLESMGKNESDMNLAITERGFSFGYQDLIVDMRSFKIMKETGCPVIFDITHSTQQPPSTTTTTGGFRSMGPLLTRAALSTGYVDGFFMEVHPNPNGAKSDNKVQISFKQADLLLTEICEFSKFLKNYKDDIGMKIDKEFEE